MSPAVAKKGAKPAKPAGKTPRKTPMRTPEHGRGQLRVGGTNKGGPGRPPDEFKAMLAALASRDETMAAVRRILDDPSHPQFIRALEYATERGYGKVAQAHEVKGEVEHRHAVVLLPPVEGA